nr:hypothetical protein [Paraburkholderia sp. BL8N3]
MKKATRGPMLDAPIRYLGCLRAVRFRLATRWAVLSKNPDDVSGLLKATPRRLRFHRRSGERPVQCCRTLRLRALAVN